MFTKYASGAEEDITEVCRFADGAEQGAEAVYAYKSGAEEKVWPTLEVMVVASCTLTNGDIKISSDGTSFLFSRFEDYTQQYGSLSGGGYIQFELEGEWDIPVEISFDWLGGTTYMNNTYTYGYRKSAGSITIVTTGASGQRSTTAVSRIGSEQSATEGGTDLDYGTYTGYAPAADMTITKIAIRIEVISYDATYYNGAMNIQLYNLAINGEAVGFPTSAESYSKYISDY